MTQIPYVHLFTLIAFASIGMTVCILKLITFSTWLQEIGDAYIRKHRKPSD